MWKNLICGAYDKVMVVVVVVAVVL